MSLVGRSHLPSADRPPAVTSAWMWGVQLQLLAPGVQRSNDAGASAQVLWIIEQLKERVTHNAKEYLCHLALVGQPKCVQLGWYRKDDVVVFTAKHP